MSSLRLILAAGLLWLTGAAAPALAQMTALARVDAQQSRIADTASGVEVRLALSQPVPWRVFTLDNPRRLVLDLSEAVWPADLAPESAAILGLTTGAASPGWSRLVLDLDQPMVIGKAGMETGAADGGAVLRVGLVPADPKRFAEASGMPRVLATDYGTTDGPAARVREDGPLRVVIDPGHGGRDPGAQSGGLVEADLLLSFARELRETLLRSGGFEVTLTRDDDVFVPLEARITIARAAGADVFLSLHADALPEESGAASGATVYTLATDASDRASQRLAERHDQSDLLSGVDLDGQSDEIALVLMDLARTETEPRTLALADTLVAEIREEVGRVNSRPRRSASFSVLKAPDFPSVLVELGFLSSPKDRERLTSAEWRGKLARGILGGLATWAEEDRQRSARLRQARQ